MFDDSIRRAACASTSAARAWPTAACQLGAFAAPQVEAAVEAEPQQVRRSGSCRRAAPARCVSGTCTPDVLRGAAPASACVRHRPGRLARLAWRTRASAAASDGVPGERFGDQRIELRIAERRPPVLAWGMRRRTLPRRTGCARLQRVGIEQATFRRQAARSLRSRRGSVPRSMRSARGFSPRGGRGARKAMGQ